MVIPVRSQCGLLESSPLSALLHRGVLFDIIVVTNGSNDDTADTVAEPKHPSWTAEAEDWIVGLAAGTDDGGRH
jgi:hypothetical protein